MNVWRCSVGFLWEAHASRLSTTWGRGKTEEQLKVCYVQIFTLHPFKGRKHTLSSRLFPLSDVMESCWRALHNHSCACFASMHPLGALKPWKCTHKHTSGTKILSPSDIYFFFYFFFFKWPSDWANAHFAAWDKDTKHIPRVLKLSLPTG